MNRPTLGRAAAFPALARLPHGAHPMVVLANTLEQYQARSGDARVALAIGVFDGVHRGHRRIIQALLDIARAQNAAPVVMTFEPHPRAVLFGPQNAPPRLTSRPAQLRILETLGIRGVVVLEFTPELAALPPEAFVRRYLLAGPGRLCAVCVGESWRFGGGGRGTAGRLAEIGRKAGFAVVPAPQLWWHRLPVSSTRIRTCLRRGRLRTAAALLGRPYTLYAPVVRGKGLAGPQLQRPTANLDARGLQLPPWGVYAARGRIAESASAPLGETLPGIAYVGPAASLPGNPAPAHPAPSAAKVEIHFFTPQPALYDRWIELEFVRFIRPDQRFPSPDALRRRIHHDIEIAKDILACPGPAS